MILVIDNYDSFVFNLARYLERLEQPTEVVRNDRISLAEVEALRPAVIVLSPGPCRPADAGVSLAIVREFHQRIPLLGVCLGHQTIAEALGGNVLRAPIPMHGRASKVVHDGTGIFAGVPNEFSAGRYHSLVVDEASLPSNLVVNARTEDGVVMGLRHQTLPVIGLQFHPESVLTEHGYTLLANFIEAAGVGHGSARLSLEDEIDRSQQVFELPDQPVTF